VAAGEDWSCFMSDGLHSITSTDIDFRAAFKSFQTEELELESIRNVEEAHTTLKHIHRKRRQQSVVGLKSDLFDILQKNFTSVSSIVQLVVDFLPVVAIVLDATQVVSSDRVTFACSTASERVEALTSYNKTFVPIQGEICEIAQEGRLNSNRSLCYVISRKGGKIHKHPELWTRHSEDSMATCARSSQSGEGDKAVESNRDLFCFVKRSAVMVTS
jgi:hypothetical protein